jgi:excisionase family DNA binding protein
LPTCGVCTVCIMFAVMTKAPNTATDELLSVTQAAPLLGISRRAAYYLIKEGVIPGHQYPSRSGNASGPLRIRRSEIDRFIKNSAIEQ